MKTPKVIFKKNVFFEINTIDPILITNDHIRKEIYEAVQLAEEMAVIAVQTIEYIYRGTSEEDIKKRWNKSRDVVKYFGSNLEVQHIKIVRKRMRRIHRWLHKRKLTIRLLSQKKASSHTLIGCNYGSVLSPRRFVLYPNWFKKNNNYKASVIIHELMHEWFNDQKIVFRGRKRKVYGGTLARKLARENPKKARRSAENYQQFCQVLWEKEILASQRNKIKDSIST